MERTVVSPYRRLRLKALGAAGALALMALCAGCGNRFGLGEDRNDDGGSSDRPGIVVLAGDAVATGNADGKGGAARFNVPLGIAIDATGNLYVADRFNFVIRKITPAGEVSTFAGVRGVDGMVDGSGDGARFSAPTAIAIDAGGNLFVTDYLAIRKITPTGTVTTVTTIALGSNIDGRSINQFLPAGIAVENNGDLFVTNGIGTRRITLPNRTAMIEGVATQNNVSGTRDLLPRGVALDGSGNVFVADLRHAIGRAATTASSLTTFAGTPDLTGSADGAGPAARFEQVVALSVDKQGNVYAADAVNNLIRKITPNAAVSTVAGVARETTLRTGALPGSLASLGGVVADGNGHLYATSGNAVVKITLP